MQQFIIIMVGSKILFYSLKLPLVRQPCIVVTSDIFGVPDLEWDLHSYVLQNVTENRP
jgi:hypothetical protein